METQSSDIKNLISALVKVQGATGYFVSDSGDVFSSHKSIRYPKHKGLRKINPAPISGGYLAFKMKHDNGQLKTTYIHRLVATAFLKKRQLKNLEVSHLDGDKLNNSSTNLSWSTHKENESDKIKHGTRSIGSKNGAAKLNDKAVLEIRAMYKSGIPQAEISRRSNISKMTICRVVNRKLWKHI